MCNKAVDISIVELPAVGSCPGVTVVIDVLRAFTTAAYAFQAGAERIILVRSVEEALQLKHQNGDFLLMGEVDGSPIPGFDFNNSPAQFLSLSSPLRGRTLVQRTTAGTKGVVLCRDSGCLLAASFVCAAATARYIQDASIRDSGSNPGGNVRGDRNQGDRVRENRVQKNAVRLVVTGRHAAGDGDEDRALADYLAELLCNRHPSAERYLQRVTDSSWGQRFLSPDYPDQPEADIPLCQALDRFPFAMPIEEEEGGLLVMRKHCF